MPQHPAKRRLTRHISISRTSSIALRQPARCFLPPRITGPSENRRSNTAPRHRDGRRERRPRFCASLKLEMFFSGIVESCFAPLQYCQERECIAARQLTACRRCWRRHRYSQLRCESAWPGAPSRSRPPRSANSPLPKARKNSRNAMPIRPIRHPSISIPGHLRSGRLRLARVWATCNFVTAPASKGVAIFPVKCRRCPHRRNPFTHAGTAGEGTGGT